MDDEPCYECGDPTVTRCRRCDLGVCEGHVAETTESGPLCTLCAEDDAARAWDDLDRKGWGE